MLVIYKCLYFISFPDVVSGMAKRRKRSVPRLPTSFAEAAEIFTAALEGGNSRFTKNFLGYVNPSEDEVIIFNSY